MQTILKRQARVEQTDAADLLIVASDESADRVGDVIRASGWQLDAYKANPIVLFGHDHANIVGTADVSVKGNRLLAAIKLAEEGTSPLVNTVRALVRQGILKAASVGFRGLDAKPLKSGGLEFIKQELVELSLVAVPCNPQALALAKSFGTEAVVLDTTAQDFIKSIRDDIAAIRASAPQSTVI